MTAERQKFAPAPYKFELEAGKTYLWCTCGQSETAPICDAGSSVDACTPTPFVARATEIALLCGCYASDDAPYCDGQHNYL